MFYVFFILILTHFVTNSSSHVLQRINHDGDTNLNEKHIILQAGKQDNTTEFTTKKSLIETEDNITNTKNSKWILKLFNRKLFDEMLSFKRNKYSRDVSTECTSSVFYSGTPALEIRRQPSAEDLFYSIDNMEQKVQNNEDVEFRHLFPKKISNTDIPTVKVKGCNHIHMQHDELSNNVVNLRSLSNHISSDINDLRRGSPLVKPCTFSQSLKQSNWGKTQPHHGYPYTSSKSPQTCGDCHRTTILYTLMPYYVPYEPHFHHLSHIYNKVLDEYSGVDNKEKDNKNCGDQEHDRRTTKQNEARHDKQYIVGIDYDVPRESEVKWNVIYLQAHPKKLVNNVIDDLLRLYPDSICKRCYCSSSSH